MRSFSFLFLLLLTANLAAQTSLDFKYGVKLSNLSTMQHSSTYELLPSGISIAVNNVRTFDLLQFVPAFTWQTKMGDFSEVSIPIWQLQRQQLSRTDSNNVTLRGVVRQIDLGVQYTYSIRFLKKKTTHWLPMLGFGVLPYYHHTHFEPISDLDFSSSESKFGFQGKLHPHLMWLPNSRFFMDLGLSINLLEFSVATYLDSSPTLPIQGGYTLNWDMLNGNNGLQIGVGVRL